MKTNPALRFKCAAVALSLLAVSGFSALAATFTVTNPNDSGPGSLRDAISAAASGDKITFDPALNGQTITLTSGELLINKNLNIQGPGANQLTVSGNHASRVFHVQTDATLSGLTIANGSAADFGGGIAQDNVVNTTLAVTKCVITGNQATGANSLGGGVYLGASFGLIDCTVSQNSAVNGGGIYVGNNYVLPSMILRSTIDHNTASAGGGGIYAKNSNPAIGDITVAYNSAPVGGGFYIDNAEPVIQQSTITGNSAAPNSGGGIYSNYDGFSLYSSIVAFQQGGGNVAGNSSSVVEGSVITDDPNLNLDPNGLQFNGGPTRTIALLPGSSAIDAPATPTVINIDGSSFRDQRGADRPIGSNRDIGAYEYNPNSCATVVTNTNDSGPGSLRCALASAFTGDTITFAPNVGPQINLTSGELLIAKDLTILGPGAKALTVSGSSLSRVFRVTGAQVTMSGLTIANGLTPSLVGPVNNSSGAGIQVTPFGSSLAVTTGLTLSACTVTGNQVAADAPAAIGVGIGIGNASATISNCTISNNHATTSRSSGGGIGGNVPGDVTIVNTTISGNSSDLGGGIGIHFPSTGTTHTTIINSTVSGNTAITSGGGIHFYDHSLFLGSNLIALNSAPTGPDIFTDPILSANPIVNSAGYNLVGTAIGYTWINGAGDQLGIANPGLQLDANNLPLLRDNGGPTQTIALVQGSAAIDRGFADASVTSDQRGSGFARKIGAAVDVGAFEVQPLPVVTIPGRPTNPTATTNPTPRFYFTVDQPAATTFCSVAGDPFVQCTSPFTTKTLPDGSYTLSVYAKDSVGNNGPTATFAFAIDHAAPLISIPVPPNHTTTNSHSPSFTFADNSAPGTAVAFQCRVDAGGNAPCVSPFTATAALPDGSHTFTVIGTDAAGNVGQASLAFVVDTTPPAVTITSGPPVGNTNPTPTFAFTTFGAISTQCRVDSGAFVSCTSPFTVPTPLAVGAHTFQVNATDAAGNVGSASSTFAVNAAVVLVSIQVTPVNPSVPAGRTQQFTATGAFSDGTNQDLTSTCTWTSNHASVATISNAAGSRGVATGVATGTSTISAAAGSVVGSTTLTVTAALPSFTISVSPSTVKQGGLVTVTVNYSNPSSTAQTLTLKLSLTTPKTKTLMLTVPLTLKAAKSGSASFPLPILKSTPVGTYSLTLDAFLGATQVSTSSVQLTVTK